MGGSMSSTGNNFNYPHRLRNFKLNAYNLSIREVNCKNHLSECTIHLFETYKANATYVKIRSVQSSVGQVLQVFHLYDCHFYWSQTIRRVKFRTLPHHCSIEKLQKIQIHISPPPHPHPTPHPPHQWWGLLNQFSPFRYFPDFSELSKQILHI